MSFRYKAVCDKHREMVDIFVGDVVNTNHFLAEKNDVISRFLINHIDCNLRLVHDYCDLVDCADAEYKDVGKKPDEIFRTTDPLEQRQSGNEFEDKLRSWWFGT